MQEKWLVSDDGVIYVRDDVGDWQKLYGDVLPEEAKEIINPTNESLARTTFERLRAGCDVSEPINLRLLES